MFSLHWLGSLATLTLLHTLTEAVFEDFIIKSKNDLTRFGMDAEGMDYDESNQMAEYDSCDGSIVPSYGKDVDIQTLQAALQNGEFDVEALKLQLLKMAEDPALLQYLQNAVIGGNSIDDYDTSYEAPALLTQHGHYEMCD